MAPKKRGSANTKASPSLEETSYSETLQMNQVAKMIQGYEEKNNAMTEMMIEMKKMFKEKMQTLEMENNVLKEKARKSGYSRTKRNSMSQSRKTKDKIKVKIVESSSKSPRSSATPSSKIVNSNKTTSQSEGRSLAKHKEEERKKVINHVELNERKIEEVV